LRVKTECLIATDEVRSRISDDSTDSPAAGLSQPVHELRAPFHVELAEYLAKVVVDRVRANKQLSGDLSVGATFRREPSDADAVGDSSLTDRGLGPFD